MKYIIVILVLLMATPCFGGMCDVVTGYGYFKDSAGNIVSKAELPVGKHPIKDGYTYTEVKDKKAIDKVDVYVEPETDSEKNSKKISKEIRQMAIDSLKAKGDLPANYTE